MKIEHIETAKKRKKHQKVKKSKIPKGDKGVTREIKEFFSQNLVPVEEIINGMVKLKKEYGGHYVKFVEIEPTNFLLMDVNKRADIVEGLREWLKVAPITIQFHMYTSKSDTESLIANLNKKTADESDKNVLIRKEKYIEKIKNLSKTEGLSKRFFIVFRYEGSENGYSTDIDDITSAMDTVAQYIAYYFNSLGNSVVEHTNENAFLATLLYREMNPKSSIDEGFTDRAGRIFYDQEMYAISRNEEFDVNNVKVDDLLATRGINRSNPNYIIRDGLYSTYLYVKGNGYRHNVVSGWADEFIKYGEGVDCNIYCKKMEHNKAVDYADRAMRMKRAAAKDRFTSDEKAENLFSSADTASYIKECLTEYNEDLYDVAIMITITAKTPNELHKIKYHIKKTLKGIDYQLQECYLHQEEAYLMSLPLLIIDEHIFKKARRNMLTTGLASTYMFSAFELYEDNGILLGTNMVNNSLAVLDLYRRKKYKNANCIAMGSPGSGKTILMETIAHNLRVSGTSVFLILPEKGWEYRELCKALGGEFVNLSPASKSCINILEIRPRGERIEFDEDNEDDIFEPSLVASKIQQIITFIQLLKPKEEMTDEEEAQLSIVLYSLYEEYGINEDNNSIWEDKDNKILKRMPVLKDLYIYCMNDAILSERVAVALRIFVQGNCKNFNGQTNVDLNNKLIVFDCSNAQKYLAALAFIAVDCSYDRIKEDSTEPCAIILDECWKYMINEQCSQLVLAMAKLVRAYTTNLLLSTQSILDYFAIEEGYGKKILNACNIQFLLGMEKSGIKELVDNVNLTESEASALTKYKEGQMLMCANGEKIPIKVKVTEEEMSVFKVNNRR